MTAFDTSKPFRELGDKSKGQADYVEQNGIIFAWSESNVQYEQAWWLAQYKAGHRTTHIENLLKDRPFNNWELIQ